MTKPGPYFARIEAFNLMKGDGVTITKVRNVYNLTVASVARLQPAVSDDEMNSLLVVFSDSGVWKSVQREFKSIWKNETSLLI